MKYLIIGLGNFGKTLAEELTDKGHDVIGIDRNEHRIEEVKDRISVAYIMDATERLALKALPLDEIDCAIVAIGQSMDYSLRVVAALKELAVETIYARALDQTHQSILKAMNIQKIFIPESYAARIYVQKITEGDTSDMF
ncbi:MAG: NAD-binding protein [Parabacteroides sp.]|nr:NAD-binding protein [Parabacteroides sp.]